MEGILGLELIKLVKEQLLKSCKINFLRCFPQWQGEFVSDAGWN